MDYQLYVPFKGCYRRWYDLAPFQTAYGYNHFIPINSYQLAHQPLQIPYEVTPQTSETNHDNTICINDALPDDLLEEILLKLSTTIIVQASGVCKKWKEIIHSTTFSKKFLDSSLRKPFYLMLTHPHEVHGHMYDPELRNWSSLEVPFTETLHSAIASSSGLICFMPEFDKKEVYVYNPITSVFKRLVDRPSPEISDFTALTISEGGSSSSYNVTIIRSQHHGDSYLNWQISMDEYNSERQKWESLSEFELPGRRGGSDCVECEGVLYFVVYKTSIPDPGENPVAICTYDKNTGSLEMDLIELPCPLTCIRLMKMKGKVVMVGGIERRRRRAAMKGIRVWVLEGRRWAEVARVPEQMRRSFEDMDEVFASSGFDETIYIQSYGERKVLVFEMGSGQWRWAERAPAVRQRGIQLFSGVCFEPRFDTVP